MTGFVRAGSRFNRFVMAALLALPLCAGAATFTVTKTADTADGTCDSDCSLREAVIAANVAAGADTIILPAGTYVLTLVGASEDLSATGDLDITGDTTITGAGSGTTIIDGNGTDRVIDVTGTALNVSVSGVTIRNGSNVGFGGGIRKNGGGLVNLANAIVTANIANNFGGGINNNDGASFNVDFTTVSNNTATSGFGGGINNNVNGALTVRDSTVSGNTAGGFGGGGINNNSVGTLLVVRSVVSGNTAQSGGGVNNNSSGQATITETTVSGNTATTGGIGGGGILNNSSGPLFVFRSTVSGNSSAGFGGGGIMNNSSGTLVVENSTISGNTTTGSNGGGGVYQNSAVGTSRLTSVTLAGNNSTNGGRNFHANFPTGMAALNTIIADPVTGSNCGGGLPTSQGFNLASDASCNLVAANDVQNANPLLGPLANNGGLTQTHGLQAGSPAIDTGSPASPPIDQRGVARPVGAGFDKGAFEGTLGAALPTLAINSVSQNEGNAGSSILTFTVTLSAASAQTVTVDFASANGTATAGSDYNATSGTLTFVAGTTTQPIPVTILGDTVPESNETFTITLSNAANATIAGATGTGTITNDDAVAPPPATTVIPTLSEWMLALLALLLAGVAATAMRRER